MMIERQSPDLEFVFNPDTLSGRLVQKPNGVAWQMDLTTAGGIAFAPGPEPMHVEYPSAQQCRALQHLRPLRPADLQSARSLDDGVELDLHIGGAGFRILLRLGEEGSEFVFSLQPRVAGSSELIAAQLPGPLAPASGDPIQVLLAYRHQGRLLTGKPGPLETERSDLRELSMSEGQHRLRCFGVLGDTRVIGSARAGYLAIIDENADARIHVSQAQDGRLSACVSWLPSRGTLGYARTLRYRFQDRPTVTTLAKGFRRYVRTTGLFKSLKEKIAERPRVGNLIGATACFIGYEDSALDYVGTFRELRKMGHERFFIFPLYHINCGFEGHFAGMKIGDFRSLAAPLRELGGMIGSWTWLAGVPDRPALRRLAQQNADGSLALNWKIGDELYPQMCMQRAVDFFAECGTEIAQGDAHHFDTTASNSLMECYSPAHPMSRRDDRAYRVRLFHEAAARGCIVASEGVKDWAVPHYDMGSNKEVPAPGVSPAFRAVPLQHLVYHDALFSLWWEGHSYDCPYFSMGGDPAGQALTDVLYGDMPLIFPVGRQYRWKGSGHLREPEEFEQSLDLPLCREAARRAVDVARHFARVATEEMTAFSWLTDDGAVQQTEFANGISVIANFGSQPFRTAEGPVVAPMAWVCR